MAWAYWAVIFAGLVLVVAGLDRLFEWATYGRRRHPDDVTGQVSDFERARYAHRMRRRESRWYSIDDEADL
jgi:hypothetical protein